jgi:hypothetical protein
MLAARLFSLLVPVATLFLLYSLIHLVANRNYRGAPVPQDSPEQQKRRHRQNLYTRVMFVFWTLFLFAQRAFSIYLFLLADTAKSGDIKGAVGMTLVFVDPLGILMVLGGWMAFKNFFGVPIWPESGLTPFYIVASSLLNAAAIWFLWTCSRGAFVRAPRPK